MFREKLTSDPSQRGYLYIRESDYKRDKRTLKRKPARLGDGSAAKERGKYSKKKDIYCGRICEVEVRKLESFNEYLIKNNHDPVVFTGKLGFEELIDEFVIYVIYVYEIDEKKYFGDRKVVFTIGDGYMSQETINWLKKFKIRGLSDSVTEMKRFYYRALECGIFDDDIINSLYLKVVPDIDREDIKKEIEELKKLKPETHKFEDYRDFMKKN